MVHNCIGRATNMDITWSSMHVNWAFAVVKSTSVRKNNFPMNWDITIPKVIMYYDVASRLRHNFAAGWHALQDLENAKQMTQYGNGWMLGDVYRLMMWRGYALRVHNVVAWMLSKPFENTKWMIQYGNRFISNRAISRVCGSLLWTQL